jgi:hypothetical protein
VAVGPIRQLREAGVTVPPLCGPGGGPLDDPERAAAAEAILSAVDEAGAARTKPERIAVLARVILAEMAKLEPAPKPAPPPEPTPPVPQFTPAARLEAAAAIGAHARGEPVDLGGIAVRRALEILAIGEDKDASSVLRFLAPARKPEGAPDEDVDASPEAQRERALEMLARVDPMAAIRARNG